MGQYLMTGIVQDFVVEKRRLSGCVSLEMIIESLKNETNLNLDYYDYSEDEENFCWAIKPCMLEGNFADFFEAQAQMYANDTSERMQHAIQEVRQAKSGEELIALAAEKRIVNFQLVDHFYDSVDFSMSVPLVRKYFDVNYRMIIFFMDGKILMECYGNILSYFEKLIRLQRSQYPVVDCIKCLISS